MSKPRFRQLCLILLVTTFIAGCTTMRSQKKAATSLENAQRSSTIVGAWRPVELALRQPGGEWETRPTPQSGFYVFSERHYSYAYIPGGRLRPHFSNANAPTEAERAAAYDTFIAGAGTYSFDGAVLQLKADVRKNPNEMTGHVWRWDVEMIRGDTIRFIFRDPPFLPGRDWRTTLVRVQ
jgi:hypothetical protein